MTHSFSTELMIEAPRTAVWATLADIGSIYRWNPGVVASHCTSDAPTGLNATRYCDLGGKNYLDEQVVDWQPEERLTMRVTGTNLPFKSIDIRFTLREVGEHTAVTVSPVYTLKYGPLGQLLNAVYVGSTYEKGMQSLLRGLKEQVERES